jgi:hypothetical protein
MIFLFDPRCLDILGIRIESIGVWAARRALGFTALEVRTRGPLGSEDAVT